MDRSHSHSKVRVLLLIRSLEFGGAERQLTNLARGLVVAGHEVCVAVYYPGGPYLAELLQAGVNVVPLNKRGRWNLVSPMWRLRRLVRRIQPDVLYGFMPTENLACLLVSRLVRPRVPVVWGIRASDVDARIYGLLPRAVRTLQHWLARAPDLVISNSHAGLKHLRLSTDCSHHLVIPNGIDTTRFRPSAELARAGKAMLRLQSGARLVGCVGRLDPMKGHDCFLRAATIVSTQLADIRFVIVGSGSPEYRSGLITLAERLGISDRLIWQDTIAEIELVYNAIDVLALSSIFGEGFPNVVAEAMACGTPVVATDVGDTARVLGSHGCLVPPNKPSALAAGIVQALRSEEDEGAAKARRDWIVARYDIEALVSATEDALATARLTRSRA